MPVLIAPIGWLLLSCTSARPGASPSGSGVVCPSPTTWYADLDGDHYGAGAAIASSCVMPANAAANTDDCDDGDAAVNPSAVEVCNGIDDDCDGVVDPTSSADILSCYTDADRDGYGDPDSPVAACACTDGLSANADDCDDSRANAYPGAEEILYDGIDEACDGLPGEYDRDGDGYDWDGGKGVDGRDCDDTDPDINPTVLDLCDDDIDQDCDGVIDECGFSSMTDSSDAWLTVSRYPDAHPLGLMGNHLAYAGDSDGDGRPEIVAYEGYYPVGDAGHTGMTFRLVEAPSNTSGGDVDVDDVTIARWVYPDDDDFAWADGKSLGENDIDASQDFDGDGIVDYLFGNSGSWYDIEAPHDYSPNAISLWYGPPTYQDKKGSFMDMADAQTATITTGDVFFFGSFAVTVPPGGDRPWQLAAHLFPASQDDLGSNHAALALLTDADFQGEEDPTDASSIRTSDGYEALWTVQSDDIDGDGFRDLVVTTRRYPDHTSPPVVMAFAGPFDGDRTMDSADLSIRGNSNDGYFGLSLDLSVDPTGDGYGKLLVGLPVGPNPFVGSLLLYQVGLSSTPQALGIHDAYARVDSDHDGEDLADIIIQFQSRWLGDIDQDGIEEIGVPCVDGMDGVVAYCVILSDAPRSGTVLISDGTQRVYGDRYIDGESGFGSWMDGRHDYDGDGWPDLVVGAYGWDGEPGEDSSPQGRFSIYRGENGPVGGS